MKSELRTLSTNFQSHKEDSDKRFSRLELWTALQRRGLIVIGLWIGSLTGQLNTDQIANIAVSLLKRVLIGG